ncbi:MAG: hypothetical protein GY807_21125 [Gammaproteobacteria bacterium]|nr:hypothetical protein [Gammaproteobacteria bacterium]
MARNQGDKLDDHEHRLTVVETNQRWFKRIGFFIAALVGFVVSNLEFLIGKIGK